MTRTTTTARATGLAALVSSTLVSAATAQGGGPTPVRVDGVRSESIVERHRITGDVRAVHRSDVAAREKGIVLELVVREGQAVVEGDVLARQDASNLELELAVLRAQLAPAEAAVREAEAELEQRENDLEALEKLRQREAAKPKELSDARTAVRAAEARKARVAAEVDVLEARVARLADRIDDMVIRAPFAGTITQRRTERGAWLGEGQPVVELVSTDEVEVWLEVPQQLLGAATEAETGIRVAVDAIGEAFELESWRVVPDVARTSRTFRVVGVFEDPGSIAPGMSVTAEVPTGARATRLTVSRDALLRNQAGPYVYLAMPGAEGEPASAAPVQVDVLFHVGERVAIRAGRLGPDARVVVEGNERLFPMAPIVPIEGAPGGEAEKGGGSSEASSAEASTGASTGAGAER